MKIDYQIFDKKTGVTTAGEVDVKVGPSYLSHLDPSDPLNQLRVIMVSAGDLAFRVTLEVKPADKMSETKIMNLIIGAMFQIAADHGAEIRDAIR